MKKNKGFTLVELLAVIVVLAILALIAVPTVSHYINEAKIARFKANIITANQGREAYINANKNYVYEYFEEEDTYGIKIESLLENEAINSDLKTGGFIIKDGKVFANYISDGKYCATGFLDNLIITKSCSEQDTSAPVINDLKIIATSTTNSIKYRLDEKSIYDNESGIKNINVKLVLEKDNSSKYEETNANLNQEYVISKLKNNTKFKLVVQATNNIGGVSEYERNVTTKDIDIPTFEVNPDGWVSEKKDLNINYNKNNNNNNNNTDSFNYYFKLVDGSVNNVSIDSICDIKDYEPYNCTKVSDTNTVVDTNHWYKTKTSNQKLEIISNSSIIARIDDGYNYVVSSNYTINGIDTSAPELNIGAVSSTTNSIRIPFTVNDDESGIKKIGDIEQTFCYYGTDKNYNQKGKISNNECVLSGLDNNKTYYYKITTENNAGLITSKEGIQTTGDINKPICTVSPEGWTNKNKEVSCTFGTNSLYKEYSLDNGKTWISYVEPVAFEENGTLIARLYDGKNEGEWFTQNVTGIDKIKPELTLGAVVKTTSTLIINYSIKDNESGIATRKCQYKLPTESSWTSTNVTISDTQCKITGLENDKKYDYKIIATDKATNENVVDSNSQTGLVNMSYSTKYSEDATIATLKYSINNVSSYTRYIKIMDSTSVIATNAYACGTGDKPSSCSSTETKNLEKNIWYKVDTDENSMTFKNEANFIAAVFDGEKYIESETFHVSIPKVTNIDFDTDVSTNSVTITTKTSDSSTVLGKYQFSVDGGQTWSDKQDSNVYTFKNLKGYQRDVPGGISEAGNSYETKYNVKVRIYNKLLTDQYLDSNTKEVYLQKIKIPECSTTTTGWSTSKSYTCDYKGDNLVSKQYKIGTNGTWTDYSSSIKLTSNTTLFVKSSDGINNVVDSYTVSKVDTVKPTAKINAYRTGTTTDVSNGNTSNSYYLDFVITETLCGDSGCKIKYCKDTSNTCVPSTEVTSGTKITNYNTTSGKYYIRYKIISNAGLESGIGSFTASVDNTIPTVKLRAYKTGTTDGVGSGNTKNSSYLDFVITETSCGDSGCKIKYCKDTSNTCDPSTEVKSGTKITTYNTTSGKYYIRYKIISNAGSESDTGSYTAIVDKTPPTCTFSGESTSWRSSSVTITAKCKDSLSGCTSSSASKTWEFSSDSSIKSSSLSYTIKDQAGNSTSCSKNANIYYDAKKPSATLYVYKTGTTSSVSAGTISGTGIDFKIKATTGSSGLGYIKYCTYNEGQKECDPSSSSSIAISNDKISTDLKNKTGDFNIKYIVQSKSGMSTTKKYAVSVARPLNYSNTDGDVRTLCGPSNPWCGNLKQLKINSTSTCSGNIYAQIYYKGATKYQYGVYNSSTKTCSGWQDLNSVISRTTNSADSVNSCFSQWDSSVKTIAQITYASGNDWKNICLRACFDSSCTNATPGKHIYQ